MAKLIVILPDQLNSKMSSLQDFDHNKDQVMMVECKKFLTTPKHHKKKIALILSAMRHFALELKQANIKVIYKKIEEQLDLCSCLTKETKNFELIVISKPSEYSTLIDLKTWINTNKANVEFREDDRDLCTTEEFNNWASDKKQLRMEFFYRKMRVDHKILMTDSGPTGGKWNYDHSNRKPASEKLQIPEPYKTPIDQITQEVIETVDKYFRSHFGDLIPFHWAVTRKQALQALDLFITERLSKFGDYQDAMLEGEPWMYHSHISFYLNIGLLLPMECIQAAENAYNKGLAPINAVEGFIRQICGWREYIRGIYWLKMPEYEQLNFLNAKKTLPKLYWGAETKLNCLKVCVQETKKYAYAHHIQRLMILGNFALLAGIDPKEVNLWFWIVYADAFQWVELPNVSGMILFADGGFLASKPYAAGGSYIKRMSNYCKNCSYKVSEKTGPKACPFNYLYWNFLDRNKDSLRGNHRLAMMYKTLEKMSEVQKNTIKTDAKVFLESLA